MKKLFNLTCYLKMQMKAVSRVFYLSDWGKNEKEL